MGGALFVSVFCCACLGHAYTHSRRQDINANDSTTNRTTYEDKNIRPERILCDDALARPHGMFR